MKSTIRIMATALLAAALLCSWSCKKSDEETTTATYTVIVSAGVNGSPAAGTYTLVVGSSLEYAYTLQGGFSALKVELDNSQIASSGTLTVAAGEHYLQAYSDDNAQYSLKVSLADGVSGTPAEGTYYHPKGTVVEYSYAAAEGYTGLEVTVDSASAGASGTVVMDANHVIGATVGSLYNIQGTWTLTEVYGDGSSFEVTATFSGGFASGTVSDSDGGSGTYTVSQDDAEFTLLFPGVTYEYEGEFDDADTMSGSCKRYQTADSVVSGSWKATRNSSSTSAVSPLRSFGKKSAVTSNQ